ncbi:hypothetical protein BMF89_15295 [Arthrobacter sp. SRS-W-1-2016]|jgi:hypothetical protein|uniref:hypothetical protein n=1 Tax=Arthrobacter TaxID=1663 RepID=UPI000990D868|nr:MULTISPECIES: hypothetical protein [Arthrobacter]MDQ0210210.1 hypothetical protein [Arthrobacter bambusae]MDQ0234660.1 hypothetical protein [Arthrobacter bambusae]OOP60697.1 hypothetical protein BMF89_15295 [Arthrobacter sp. SRS-W-1-2016]
MDFELLTIQDCPHGSAALELFSRAVELEGQDPVLIAAREIVSDEEAEASGFHGSPTFLVDGKDLFPSTAEPAMTCRVYRTAGGLSGLPSLESLRQAIQARLAA